MHAIDTRPVRRGGSRTRTRTSPSLVVALAAVFAVGGLAGFAGFGGPGGGPLPIETPSAAPSPTPTPEPSPTPTPEPSPTPTPTPTPTPEPSPTPAPTSTPAPSPTPTPTPTIPPLPACTYADNLTPRYGYDDWATTILDPIFRLPSWYAPPDLVDTGSAGLNGGYLVRRVMLDDLRTMVAAARAAGVPFQVVSAYRSYNQQKATFERWVRQSGYQAALRKSARPGHSEHQLGTTLDVTSIGARAPWEYRDWAATPAGGWLAANA